MNLWNPGLTCNVHFLFIHFTLHTNTISIDTKKEKSFKQRRKHPKSILDTIWEDKCPLVYLHLCLKILTFPFSRWGSFVWFTLISICHFCIEVYMYMSTVVINLTEIFCWFCFFQLKMMQMPCSSLMGQHRSRTLPDRVRRTRTREM